MVDLCYWLCVIGGLDVDVLIIVLIGVGKEVVVYVLYDLLVCVVWFFVVINCVVLFVVLIEFELFGYEVGVFFGVVCVWFGKFEYVCGGMVLLDEIGLMLLDL